MGLAIVYERDLAAPVFVCDSCGEIITDGNRALYVWRRPTDGEDPSAPRELFTAHKGSCDVAVSERLGYTEQLRAPWTELAFLPVRVSANAGIDLDDAREREAITQGLP